ncbi:hypothetical protein [uncultured Methanoregula sp.]|uniref:hypothetical protein n=1 Tax=uncultured Methanoregula sp. TaxID=1005933 RepID=UPI002AAB671B|nr:hypothetical protein [uncultured Methanoregula sp.]
MKGRYVHAQFILVIVLISAMSGCIAPPTEPAQIHPDASTVSQIIDENSTVFQQTPANPSVTIDPMTAGNLLTPATPFPTQVTPTLNYRSWTRATPPPEDRVCLITTNNINSYTEIKKSAETFYLKNPPMYITYSLSEVSYVSGSVQTRHKYTGQADSTSYSNVDPVSFLDITIRNRTTGTIYTEDGFGRGYGQYLSKTIKVTKPDDLLIETSGYKLSGTIGIWVKPVGNFEDNVTFVGTECKYPSDFGPNSLKITETPTPAP